MQVRWYLLAITVIAAFVSASDPVFAMHDGMPHDEMMMDQNMMWDQKMMGQHHFPYNGVCAPGFAPLDEICVLNDRCGPGAYAGQVCIMDGMIQPYLRPLHQKYAGISLDNIICAEGKHLMFKSHNAAPACINEDSIEKLKQRGWQMQKPAIACTLEYDPVCGMDGVTYGNPCMLSSEHMVMRHAGECIYAEVTNFEECVAAGNPVMESYPRQCRSNGMLFVESILEFSLSYSREGGIAGISQNVLFDTQDHLIKISGFDSKTLGPISDEDTKILWDAISENKFFELDSKFYPPVQGSADYFTYTLEVVSFSKSNSVSWTDTSVIPSELATISQEINRQIQSYS